MDHNGIMLTRGNFTVTIKNEDDGFEFRLTNFATIEICQKVCGLPAGSQYDPIDMRTWGGKEVTVTIKNHEAAASSDGD